MSRHPGKPAIRRTGKPIEITEHPPFDGNTSPRRRSPRQTYPWDCPTCGLRNPRYRAQCWDCGTERP